MKRPFREYHLLELLEQYDKRNLPLDMVICDYFREHKSLGPKDRGFIAEAAYAIIRHLSLIDYVIAKPTSWIKRFEVFSSGSIEKYAQDRDIPLHIRVCFPKPLFDRLMSHYGEEQGLLICKASNTQAPTTVRVNRIKISREDLLKRWQSQYEVEPCQYSQFGIYFLKKINFFTLEEFKQGYFEVQDEASQLVADLVDVKQGEHVLDYCAGSGGKTLAFAPKMLNTGQIYLHDIRPYALQEAKKRLKRAGIQNAQIILSEDLEKQRKLKKKMNWVLVDAPCSGTGTIRRNPDMKWKFNDEMLFRLVGQQRTIFEKALSFMQSEGRIVYATCSILPEENQMQVEHFKKIYGLKEDRQFFSLPSIGGMDGFYSVVLKK